MLSVGKKEKKLKTEISKRQSKATTGTRTIRMGICGRHEEEEGSEDSEEQLAKCGTFSNVPVLDLISGFHAIAKKKKRSEEEEICESSEQGP